MQRSTALRGVSCGATPVRPDTGNPARWGKVRGALKAGAREGTAAGSEAAATKRNFRIAAGTALGETQDVSHAQMVAQAQNTQAVVADSGAALDPFDEPYTRKDTWFDQFLINIYARKMAAQLQDVDVPENPSFSEFVRVSKEIMRGRNQVAQQQMVRNVLMSLLPPDSPAQFRKLFPPTQWAAEVNAWFAFLGFGWLVGDMELESGDVEISPGVMRHQKSIVHIKRCRYLQESGCVGMCVNMCKIPTQSFFTDDFGLPLTMTPDFQDLSCKMIFGQTPPEKSEDPATQQPCFTKHCSMATSKDNKACSKLR